MAISPKPGTLHKVTEGKKSSGTGFYLRCADPKDDLLGEIVGFVENYDDAALIKKRVNDGGASAVRITANEVTGLRKAYAILDQIYQDEAYEEEKVANAREYIADFLKRRGWERRE